MSHTGMMHRRAFCATVAVTSLTAKTAASKSLQVKDSLWSATIDVALEQDLWTDRDAYDAAHHLMVPLHAAFADDKHAHWRDQFDAFFGRFTVAWEMGEFEIENAIARAQFLWMVSRYLRLTHARSELIDENQRLLSLMVDAQVDMFSHTPAWHWSEPDFPSVRASIEWKLSNPEVDYDYYLAIHDHDQFTLAIGADLLAMKSSIDLPPDIREARDLGLRVLRERSAWGEDGGWQFQFGRYWDHRDFAYAGHQVASPDMEPAPIAGIAGDSSHSHRLPLILTSFDPGVEELEISEEIQLMIRGLAIQFVNHVLILPDNEFSGIRTTNYMDGRNGIYRWNYVTQGDDNGYLPYELSTTFLLGWWSFLQDDEIREAYKIAAEQFPLSQSEIDFYVGPNTTRERNPLFTLHESLENGMMELCVNCAAGLI